MSFNTAISFPGNGVDDDEQDGEEDELGDSGRNLENIVINCTNEK